MSELSDREILLRFMSGLGLCDHMRDVANDAFEVFKLLKIRLPEDVDDIGKFGAFLYREGLCSKTIWDSDITDEGYNENYKWVGYDD